MSDLPQSDDPNGREAPLDDRSLARRIALQVLYEIDSARHDPGEVLAIHLQIQQPSNRAARFVREFVLGVIDSRTVIDGSIRRYAVEYPLEQLAIVDRNILRLAIYEFAVSGRTPVGVAIDEAVELAKLFGADGAPSFVNGVLGALADDEEQVAQMRKKDADNGSQT